MSAAEELIFTHIAVFAGGSGAMAVLPMVKRAAMRRAALPVGTTLPPVVLMYACRNECELAALAPLLPHFCDIVVHVFYTGETALRPGVLGAAHSAPAARTSAVSLDKLEGGNAHPSSDLVPPSTKRLPRMATDRALYLTVWTFSFVLAFWSLVRGGVQAPACGSALHISALI